MGPKILVGTGAGTDQRDMCCRGRWHKVDQVQQLALWWTSAPSSKVTENNMKEQLSTYKAPFYKWTNEATTLASECYHLPDTVFHSQSRKPLPAVVEAVHHNPGLYQTEKFTKRAWGSSGYIPTDSPNLAPFHFTYHVNVFATGLLDSGF